MPTQVNGFVLNLLNFITMMSRLLVKHTYLAKRGK